MDDNYDTYNINADDAACAIARAVKQRNWPSSPTSRGFTRSRRTRKHADLRGCMCRTAKELIGQGYIGGGMLPKLNNCIDAIENGVSRVHILDGRILHCLLLEIFTNKGIGTAIFRRRGGKILS